MRIYAVATLGIALGSLVSHVALAGPPPLPPEAMEACASAQEGDACTVEHDGHTLTGTCKPIPEGALACLPDRPPPPRERAR